MSSREKKPKRRSLNNSDPGKILDLVMNLTDDSCACLQVRINCYLKEECDASLVFPIIVFEARKEAFLEAVGPIPLQKKIPINLTETMCDALRTGNDYSDTLGNVVKGDLLSILAPHLSKDIDAKKRVVLNPVLGHPFAMIVCVIDAQVPEERVVAVVYECALFVWPTLQKAISLEYERGLKQKCQQLLRVARRLFIKVGSLPTLLENVMEQAKALTKAAYCSVMLVDVDKMQLVDRNFHNPGGKCEPMLSAERRFPMDVGVAGQVIKTGFIVNVKSVKDHPNFDASVDSLPNVECKNLLCFPIRDATGIIGVGHLINKVGEPYFDAMDEEMALAFSIYCGICIVHAVVYQRIQEAHIRNTLANELVTYYMKVSDKEVCRVQQCGGFHAHPHVYDAHFNPRVLPLRELPCYVLKMFCDLGFDKKFNIPPQKIIRFILHVKKGYRDVPYHNWLHAFSVAQWASAALFNFKLLQNGYLNDLQALMYVVASLVHDLDHRGTTNSFQIEGQTALAALYSSEGSVMERHHLAQALSILNTEGCDILSTLTRREYDRALLLLRDYILASDLANYFKNESDYKMMASDFIAGNRVHCVALQAILMNSADLSDQLKDWGSVKKTAAAVLTEFFREGDAEKSRGELPIVMKDRDRCFIPDLQIQFLRNACLPLYTMLSQIIPKAEPCIKVLESHMEMWENSKAVFAEVPITAGLSVLLSPELDALIEQSVRERERLAAAEETEEQ